MATLQEMIASQRSKAPQSYAGESQAQSEARYARYNPGSPGETISQGGGSVVSSGPPNAPPGATYVGESTAPVKYQLYFDALHNKWQSTPVPLFAQTMRGGGVYDQTTYYYSTPFQAAPQSVRELPQKPDIEWLKMEGERQQSVRPSSISPVQYWLYQQARTQSSTTTTPTSIQSNQPGSPIPREAVIGHRLSETPEDSFIRQLSSFQVKELVPQRATNPVSFGIESGKAFVGGTIMGLTSGAALGLTALSGSPIGAAKSAALGAYSMAKGVQYSITSQEFRSQNPYVSFTTAGLLYGIGKGRGFNLAKLDVESMGFKAIPTYPLREAALRREYLTDVKLAIVGEQRPSLQPQILFERVSEDRPFTSSIPRKVILQVNPNRLSDRLLGEAGTTPLGTRQTKLFTPTKGVTAPIVYKVESFGIARVISPFDKRSGFQKTLESRQEVFSQNTAGYKFESTTQLLKQSSIKLPERTQAISLGKQSREALGYSTRSELKEIVKPIKSSRRLSFPISIYQGGFKQVQANLQKTISLQNLRVGSLAGTGVNVSTRLGLKQSSIISLKPLQLIGSSTRTMTTQKTAEAQLMKQFTATKTIFRGSEFTFEKIKPIKLPGLFQDQGKESKRKKKKERKTRGKRRRSYEIIMPIADLLSKTETESWLRAPATNVRSTPKTRALYTGNILKAQTLRFPTAEGSKRRSTKGFNIRLF